MNDLQLAAKDYKTWDEWVRANTFPENLVQTSLWPGDFFIFANRDDQENLQNGVRVDVRSLWLKEKMWWIRGETKLHQSNLLLEPLITKAKKEKVAFVRIQSTEPINIPKYKVTEPKFLFHIVDPETTLLADLKVTEADLLSAMHSKTRYNIRYAEKQGVATRVGALEEFMSLYHATNERKKLGGYSKEYIASIVNLPSPLSAHVRIAYTKDTLLAANLYIGFGTTYTYLFGGSSDAHRNLMAPHLLHWESMRYAKQAGYSWYDFGGISDTKPDWRDITRFKRGFVSEHTNREINHGTTYDIVIQPRWYHLFSLARRLRGV